jgi:hypothetical protein
VDEHRRVERFCAQADSVQPETRHNGCQRLPQGGHKISGHKTIQSVNSAKQNGGDLNGRPNVELRLGQRAAKNNPPKHQLF